MSLRNILNKVGVIEPPCLTPLSMFENDCTYKQSHQEIWNTLYENAKKKIERGKEMDFLFTTLDKKSIRSLSAAINDHAAWCPILILILYKILTKLLFCSFYNRNKNSPLTNIAFFFISLTIFGWYFLEIYPLVKYSCKKYNSQILRHYVCKPKLQYCHFNCLRTLTCSSV